MHFSSFVFIVFVLLWYVRQMWIDFEGLGFAREFTKEKKRTQFHLSTGLVLMFTIGVLMWINFTPDSDKWTTGQTTTFVRDYGWPFNSYRTEETQHWPPAPSILWSLFSNQSTKPVVVSERTLSYVALFFNIAAWLFILRRVWTGWEWWLSCWRTPKQKKSPI